MREREERMNELELKETLSAEPDSEKKTKILLRYLSELEKKLKGSENKEGKSSLDILTAAQVLFGNAKPQADRIDPILVVADIHLGLLAGKRVYLIQNNSQSDAIAFADFVSWLEILQAQGVLLIDRGKWGPPLSVRNPGQLVLLGDYLELWDASDAAIDMSSRGIWNRMEKLTCEKVYVSGNHDFASSMIAGRFPQGASRIQVLPNTYPETGWLTRRVTTGQESFIFLHGHQFDRTFRNVGKLWAFVSYLRDGAEAFRLWSWILFLVTLALLSICIANWGFPWLVGSFFSGVLGGAALALLFAAFLPRFIVTIGRPAYSLLAGTRYEPGKTLNGFASWWKKLTKSSKVPQGRLYVVYGHTHEMDIFDSNDILKYTGAQVPKELVLLNIPSWVSDVRPEYKDIFRDAFLYIDGDPHWIGWDWKEHRPFYMPPIIARTIAAGIPIDTDTAELLAGIGWPRGLLEKITEPNPILARRHPVLTSRFEAWSERPGYG
jgi:UDP-2,3-diacylglucosamine pyrophosphatase LpxH